MPQDVLAPVAITTLIVLALADLHLELVAGAVAWASAWWVLREPGVPED